jgi:hypothetical protein
MLADTIRAGRGGMMDRLTGGSVTARAHAIQRAGRFLAPGVVVSAYALRQTPLVSQLRVLSPCRLPFTTTWFEWPGSDSVYALPGEQRDAADARPRPYRGVVETDECRQRGVMTFAWSQRIAGLNICPLAAAR